MQNPKTSIPGLAMVGVVLAYMGYGFYIGKPMDMQEVLTALALIGGGIGLIGARDSSPKDPPKDK